MRVWLLQTGEPLHVDGVGHRPMRAMNLADALTAAGHHVTLWSSEFFHQEKRHRDPALRRVKISPLLDLRLLPSPGYRRNIGIGRLVDHAVLALALWRQLRTESDCPDAAFIGYPPIEVAAVMARWLKKYSVPTLLDLKDQWPDLFIDALPKPIRPLGRLALAPYFFLAKRAMRDASGLSAMSPSFLDWGRRFSASEQSRWDRVVALTAPPSRLSEAERQDAREWWDNHGVVDDGLPRICFVGSHSPAFDIGPIIIAAKYFAASGRRCQFVICGDGPESQSWRESLQELPGVVFPGWVNRAQVETLAERCLAALAPYTNSENFMSNIPNKVVDALSLGLPVLSPLRGEVAGLIEECHVGFSYGERGSITLHAAIEQLADNGQLRDSLSENARTLFCERFAYEDVYGGLVLHLERMSADAKSKKLSHPDGN
jgi:glycosyltransferase involved in cell wall biosynthesis